MIRLSCYLLIIFFSVTVIAAQDESEELQKRIATSDTQLKELQSHIDSEHRALARELHEQLQRVKTLRNKANNIRRLEDEQLLNINKLKERNQKWLAQKNYQLQLVSAFEQQTQSLVSKQSGGIDATQVQKQFNRMLSPRFETKQIIGSDNKLANFESIKFGPVEYALNDKEAGLVSAHPNSDEALLNPLRNHNGLYHNMLMLKGEGTSNILFDPTLGNADKLNKTQFSMMEYIERGGTWAIPIISFALAAIVIGLIKAVQLFKLPNLKALEQQVVAHADNPLSKLKFKSWVEHLDPIQKSLTDIVIKNNVSQKRDDLLIATLSKHKASNEKYIGVIATCAAVAPLLGLLGTVSGMIHTFMMMNVFGSGDASVVSGGISQALITTELGLIVAIPSLVISALLTRKVKSFQSSLESLAIQLSKVELTQAGTQHD
ncbi:MotA/TolQ/ExbB proton channel family protein [Pseudoalteromonas luteoviolacea]|uniref:MotA/TolQ/ExbB proton channel family protein n=1 Tax=Pseudoalteromonas luteoviolacea TaxID=43657 RepID=UPI001B3727E4|nr:MotA/TolQ/ExbB proton channel family protein [Pseudoalteromonas luteoviolacea]MBQ4809913.1 MotA/TolQ/ExbB proton channel family protein [Pseudoalteromonas luteoviolacea]